MDAQVRISKADNTAQYWPNLGSKQSAIVIGPVSPFASVKCCDENRCWRPEFGPELAAKDIPELSFYPGEKVGFMPVFTKSTVPRLL